MNMYDVESPVVFKVERSQSGEVRFLNETTYFYYNVEV
jgi:hypothetical protein